MSGPSFAAGPPNDPVSTSPRPPGPGTSVPPVWSHNTFQQSLDQADQDASPQDDVSTDEASPADAPNAAGVAEPAGAGHADAPGGTPRKALRRREGDLLASLFASAPATPRPALRGGKAEGRADAPVAIGAKPAATVDAGAIRGPAVPSDGEAFVQSMAETVDWLAPPLTPGEARSFVFAVSDPAFPVTGATLGRLPDGSLAITLTTGAQGSGEAGRLLGDLHRRLAARGLSVGEIEVRIDAGGVVDPGERM